MTKIAKRMNVSKDISMWAGNHNHTSDINLYFLKRGAYIGCSFVPL